MATGAGRSDDKQLRHGGHEVDAFSEEEFARRPEVRFINKYALCRAYVRMGLKCLGALALLWATVVLLGGFVSVLKEEDFWYMTSIAFVQAAGISDALGDDRFAFFGKWIGSLVRNIISQEDKRHHEDNLLKRPMIASFSTKTDLTDLLIYAIFYPVAGFTIVGPIICIILSAIRLTKQDYGSVDGDASKTNLKPALNLFYYVSLTHSAMYALVIAVESFVDDNLVDYVIKQRLLYHVSPELLDGYFHETKRMCVNNPASTESWNLITYGAGLLDSQLPEDYASGVKLLTMLIEQDIPIRRLLIRSPGHRIQKLIGALVWRSPVEGETRWLATRIVEHIASDLNLAQFPGASECVFSLLDTSFGYNNGNQEALQLPGVRNKVRRKGFFSDLSLQGKEGAQYANQIISERINKIKGRLPWMNGSMEGSKKQAEHVDSNTVRGTHECSMEGSKKQAEHVDSNTVRGTHGDLILQGLRIFENLAHDQHNCTVIYNTKGLISKIVAPVNSNSLTEDIKTSGAWIQVVDASLKVISRLMRAPADTGREMRRQITDSRNAVENLEAVLGLQSSSSCILELQTRAMEVLAQLIFYGSTSLAGEKRKDFIERTLHIFCTVEWMERYLAEEKKIGIDKETSSQPPKRTWMDNHFNKAREARAKKEMKSPEDKKMKEAKETASRLKEMAGEALAMLSMGSQSNSEAIKGSIDVVHRLTEMLDSKTIKCKISETESMEAEMKIGCRISAAVILKQLCPHFTTMDEDYVKKTTLKKLLVELLHITAESQAQESRSTGMFRWWEHCIAVRRNDTENPTDDGQDEQGSTVQGHMQQPEERRLQAALLSLCADICAKYNIKAPDLATMVVSQEDFVGKLKKIVEENSHTTPACLAILKLTCQMVKELISDDQTGEPMETKKTITGMLSQVVVKLSEASKTMAGVETSMLFAGTDGDCYGVPARPLLSVLVKQAEESLKRRKDELGMNMPAGRRIMIACI